MRRILAALLLVFAFASHAQAQDNYCASVGAFNQSYTPAFPGCGNFVLDKLSVKPGLAFALRQLSASYTGPLINVERTSDSTFKDIYALNGVLNQGQLMAFCAGTTCGVDDWYNQGSLGSSGNVVQTTAANQPVIVSAGVLQTWNGLPTISFNGNQYLGTASTTLQLSNVSDGEWAAGAVSNSPNTTNNIVATMNPYTNGVTIFTVVSFVQAIAFGSSGGTYAAGASYSSYPNIITSYMNNAVVAAKVVSGSYGTSGVSPPMRATTCGYLLGTGFNVNLTGTISETLLWQTGQNTSDISLWRLNSAQFYSIAGVQ